MDSKISNFIITKLFGQYDVSLEFKNDVCIFIGENGLGKTTILNCLFFVLKGHFDRLQHIQFETIKICFNYKTQYELNYKDIIDYVNEYFNENRYYSKRYRINDLSTIFSSQEILEIEKAMLDVDEEIIKKYCIKFSDIYSIPLPMAKRELISLMNRFKKTKGDYKKVLDFKKNIETNLTEEILYFPTYRRIEEDINKLGIDIKEDRLKNQLIQFGMSDVQITITKMLETIRTVSINGFNKMTGLLLKQYLEGNLFSSSYYVIDETKLGIVLDRIGDEIDNKEKQKIKNKVVNNEIYNDENSYLLNFIKNLIGSYDAQSQLDERVKKFVKVCNKYLKKKSYYYDESNIQLEIFKHNSKNKIDIENLSSGEKQVISIFSKLYLEENPKKYIILFDEPELSLSIKWQSMLLPDIMESGKCNLLVAVTHSPFIFDNEYDGFAQDMCVCLDEI